MNKIKKLFAKFKAKLKGWHPIKALEPEKIKVLTAMQLKEKLDLGFLRSKKETLFKVLFSIIGVIIFTAFIYAMFYASTLLSILSLTSRLPNTVIIFLFTIMQLLSILSCTLGLTKSLYFSSDNYILLTLPCKPNSVFFSKLIVFYINELKKNLTFVVPMFLAFGLINALSPLFYLILIVTFFFISLLPVVIGALLSIPTMWITMLLRNSKYIQFILFGGFAFILLNLAFNIVALIPPNLNLIQQFATYYWEIQDFLTNFAQTFVPFAALTEMIIGITQYFVHYPLPSSSITTFLMLNAILIVGMLLVILIARPLFFKMTSKPFEYRKKLFTVQRKNRKLGKFASSLKKEIITNFRTPTLLISNMASLFILPLGIFLLNKIFASMDTRLVGQQMSIAFNVLIILLILLSNNTHIASIFSREGSAVYLLKTKPAPLKANLMAKLTINLTLSTISIAATTLVMHNVAQISISESVFLFATILLINISHILWSAQLDVVSPQYKHYKNGIHTGTSNPNETKSIGIAFALSFLFFAFAMFLFFEDYGIAWQKLTALSAVFVLSRTYLFFTNAKVYFKEM